MNMWKIAGIALIVVIVGTLMTGSLVFARSSQALEQDFVDEEHGEHESYRLEVMAEALGLTPEELQAEFDAGKSLHDILEELDIEEADLQAAIQIASVPYIEQAVSDGELTQEQADEILEWMAEFDGKRFPGMGGWAHGRRSGFGGGAHGKHSGFGGGMWSNDFPSFHDD